MVVQPSNDGHPMSEAEPIRQARFSLPDGSSQLLLIRHGESAPLAAGQSPPLLGGQADPPLDQVGHEEAQRVADRVQREPISAIYHSPLRRTAQTAAPLAELLGMEPIVDEDLREVYLGDVDGLNLRRLIADGNEHVRRAFREQRWEVIPKAESHESFSRRVRAAITRIADRHVGEAVAVFAHGGIIGQVLAEATGSSLHAFIQADNASISHVVVTPHRWIVRSFNDTGHLRDHIVVGAQPSQPTELNR
jgi:probable phosphoglycerate mutase